MVKFRLSKLSHAPITIILLSTISRRLLPALRCVITTSSQVSRHHLFSLTTIAVSLTIQVHLAVARQCRIRRL